MTFCYLDLSCSYCFWYGYLYFCFQAKKILRPKKIFYYCLYEYNKDPNILDNEIESDARSSDEDDDTVDDPDFTPGNIHSIDITSLVLCQLTV